MTERTQGNQGGGGAWAGRPVHFYTTESTQHTALAVGDTKTQLASELLRIRGAQAGTVAGGTVTFQVQADGRDLFSDALRPVSGGAFQEATDLYTIPPGTVIGTVIEATTGTPTGNANIVIDMEPYVRPPVVKVIVLRGKDRMFMSRRLDAEAANRGVELIRRNRLRRGQKVDPAEPMLASPVAAAQQSTTSTSSGTSWGEGRSEDAPPPWGGGRH